MRERAHSYGNPNLEHYFYDKNLSKMLKNVKDQVQRYHKIQKLPTKGKTEQFSEFIKRMKRESNEENLRK